MNLVEKMGTQAVMVSHRDIRSTGLGRQLVRVEWDDSLICAKYPSC